MLLSSQAFPEQSQVRITVSTVMSPQYSFLLLFLLLFFNTPVMTLPDPDPATIFQPIPLHSPPAVIPAFPEQSNLEGCPLNLPDELFHGIKSACGTGSRSGEQLHKTRCCPVLAAWMYSAYSSTALGTAGRVPDTESLNANTTSQPYDMPLLPDDSETCVEELETKLKEKGVELTKPNETCDLVYCYCGIRLHPLSCPEAFYVNKRGKLVGDKRVRRLERNCLSGDGNVDEFPGLGGCSKCLNTLYSLNSNQTFNSSKSDERTTKMHNKDCQLMGLTWLLSKNRTAYIPTVSAVLRAIMVSPDGSNSQSCALSSDGMPLAVDSSEISSDAISVTCQVSIYIFIALVFSLHIFLVIPFISVSL